MLSLCSQTINNLTEGLGTFTSQAQDLGGIEELLGQGRAQEGLAALGAEFQGVFQVFAEQVDHEAGS